MLLQYMLLLHVGAGDCFNQYFESHTTCTNDGWALTSGQWRIDQRATQLDSVNKPRWAGRIVRTTDSSSSSRTGFVWTKDGLLHQTASVAGKNTGYTSSVRYSHRLKKMNLKMCSVTERHWIHDTCVNTLWDIFFSQFDNDNEPKTAC